MIIRAMKLIVALTIICTVQVNAFTFGQRITVQLKNSSFEEMLQTVRKVSGYNVLYNPLTLSGTSPITADFNNVPVEDVLKEVFHGQPVTYTVNKNTIVVRVKRPDPVHGKSALPMRSIQQRVISGRVIDESGNPLEGVTVSIQGAAGGTQTNGNGNFEIRIPQPNSILVFSLIGYKREEVPLG